MMVDRFKTQINHPKRPVCPLVSDNRKTSRPAPEIHVTELTSRAKSSQTIGPAVLPRPQRKDLSIDRGCSSLSTGQ